MIRTRAPALLCLLLALVAVGCSFRLDSRAAIAIAQASTPWSSLNTGSTVDVVINAGETVMFDVADGSVRDLIIRGTFAVPDGANSTLRVYRNLVLDGGRTIRGPTLQKFVIEWPQVNDYGFVGGGDHLTALPSDPGLWMFRGAQWNLNGDPKRAWMRLHTTVSPGATSITLPDDPTGWQVGDAVLITPTEPASVAQNWLHFDERSIAAINGRTITLVSPTTYAHPVAVINGVTYGAEIANLSRNVQLLGRPTGHPHFYAHGLTAPIRLEYLEIRYFGPRRASPYQGVQGRYSLHVHKNGDATKGPDCTAQITTNCYSRATRSGGSVVRGVVIRNSTNMGFVPHASHGILFDHTLVHNVIPAMREPTEGAGLWWDRSPGGFDLTNSSHDITVRGMGVSDVRRVGGINSSFQRTAAYTTSEGLRNRYENIWCSGVRAPPPDTGGVDNACLIWPEGSTARQQGIWEVFLAVFHNSLHGMFGWTNDDPRTVELPHQVHDVVTYRNGRYGLDFGAYTNAYRWLRLVSAQNGTAAIRIHSLGMTYPTAPLSSFEDGYFDGNGQLYAVHTANHTTSGAPVLWLRNHFTGFTRSAFGAIATAGAPELHTLQNNTFTGNAFWLASTIPSTSLITVQDGAHGHLQLRRFDQMGEFRPEWNARVVTLSAPSR